MKFDEGRSTVVSAFQAFDFSWLVKSGASSRGPSRDMRTLGEYKETLVVGKTTDFGAKDVLGIVGPGMCLLVPFLHFPTLLLSQQSWGTEGNNGH